MNECEYEDCEIKVDIFSPKMFGRTVIYTDATEVTKDNVQNLLLKAMETHNKNAYEIDYLWNYYKGKQPILKRQKEVEDDFCNIIVENRANEIVSFKVGYLCGEPIQYVGRNTDDSINEQISKLNEYMFAENKSTQDQEIVEWQMVCGTAFRIILPDALASQELDEAPFEMYTLDPRNTFVVYSSSLGNKPLFAVKYYECENKLHKYSVYTENMYFELEGDILTKAEPLTLGTIPIFEYPANNARLGSFEIVLPLLDVLNNLASNRMDGVEEIVQAYIKFINCDISQDEFKEFKRLRAIKVKSNDGLQADVDTVVSELNQQQTQVLKDDLYNSILTICGIPNRNGGTSTSDTGAAVLLRDGWSLAEARAKDSENIFKKAEKQMLKLALKICNELSEMKLKLSNIELKFTRRNYEAIQSKSQVLISMLQNPKIHPLLAFTHSGMFSDPESAYAMSNEYYEEQMQKWEPVTVDENAESLGDGNDL